MEFTLAEKGDGTLLRVVESGFSKLDRPAEKQEWHRERNVDGWRQVLEAVGRSTCTGRPPTPVGRPGPGVRRRWPTRPGGRCSPGSPRHGAASATALARELPVTRQAVVQHLAVLDAAGLTRAPGTAGRSATRCARRRLTGAAGWMTTIARQWDDRLSAIAAIAEDADRSDDRLHGARHDLHRHRHPALELDTSPSTCTGIGSTRLKLVLAGRRLRPSPKSAARTAVVSTRHFAVCRRMITSKRPSSGRPSSLSTANFAISRMLAKMTLSKLSDPESVSIWNGRNLENVRIVEITSLIDPLPPFSSSSATVGVMPSPM